MSASIFNDVIGPVMRGPSSSHAAASARIAELIRQAADDEFKSVKVIFDPNGSLAESHKGQGTDMGFAWGLLGRSLTEEGAEKWQEIIKNSWIDIEYCVEPYGAEHPNNYRIHAVTTHDRVIDAEAISVGGGMIELTSLNGMRVSVCGDYDEVILITHQIDSDRDIISKVLSELPDTEVIKVCRRGGGTENERLLIEIKLSRSLEWGEADSVAEKFSADEVFCLTPVLPTRSHADTKVPFTTASEMLEYNRDKGLEMWELAALYESARGDTDIDAVWHHMEEICDVMEASLKSGLAGTKYADRVLPAQAHLISDNYDRLVPGDVTNTAIQYITAVMENKSAMGAFVAAPTAGSAGCLPGTVFAVRDILDLPEEAAVKGLLAAGLTGVFFAEQATFAAEIGGCQVECGAASGMAAAAVAQMMGGSSEECIDAASFALQGLTGLACDPVANRVEVPCLNKNIVSGMNAISSANVILAGYDKVIPLDEVIQAMYDIGCKLPSELRCTYGGLGKTHASAEIRERLDR